MTSPEELKPAIKDAGRVGAAKRLQAFIRDVKPGGCLMVSQGDGCLCPLCDVARVMDIENPHQYIHDLEQQVEEVRQDRVRVWQIRDEALEDRDKVEGVLADCSSSLAECHEVIREMLLDRNFRMHVSDYYQDKLQALLPPEPEPECEHEWVDARNEVVVSGQICKKCLSLRCDDGRIIPVVDVSFEEMSGQTTRRTSCETPTVSNTGKELGEPIWPRTEREQKFYDDCEKLPND